MRLTLPATCLAAVLLGSLGLGSSPAHGDGEGEGESRGAWPFGVTADAGFFARGNDWFNLGLLGAKASNPDGSGAGRRTTMPGGAQRVEPTGDAASAARPSRLRIELLFPGGPAESAGILVGDVIVGAGRSDFREEALPELAKSLRRAESGRADGVLTLRVLRGEDRKPRKIEVNVPVTGKHADDPLDVASKRHVVEAALAWLAERQLATGAYADTLSGTNGVVVQSSLAGLAWLAGGSDLASGPYQDHVERAARYVARHAGERLRFPGGMPGRGDGDRSSQLAGTDQTNWGYAHAAIFLGELQQRTPDDDVRDGLIRCAQALVESQETSGGWAHGPGGPNPLGYTELNIVTGLALCGLGLAARAGWEIPEGVLEKAEAYLKASSGGDGGVGYSDQPGQRGMGNIGRTAGAWLAYRILERGGSEWGRKMGKWTERHAGAVFGGHASLMQHVLLAGVAAPAAGRKAEKAFWATCADDLVLARAPDGALQPRPWRESLQMGSNSDVTFGEVWTTAAWTVVLACRPERDVFPGLPAWLSLED